MHRGPVSTDLTEIRHFRLDVILAHVMNEMILYGETLVANSESEKVWKLRTMFCIVRVFQDI
jgi:hypothetical protein